MPDDNAELRRALEAATSQIIELRRAIDAAHKRMDALSQHQAEMRGAATATTTLIERVASVPERIAALEAAVESLASRLPQQAAPISPWLVLMTVLGWGVTIVLALLR